MEIRKIAGIAPDDRAAVDEAFAGIGAAAGGVLQLARGISLRPGSQLPDVPYGRLADAALDVAERYTAALVTEDNGEVWTDSCAEFFIAPDTGCTTISKPPASDGCCSGRANPGPRPSTPRPRCWRRETPHDAALRRAFRRARGRQPLVAHAGHPRRRFSAMR